MFIGIGLGLVAQAIYGGVGDNALNDYGTPHFLADFIEREYRNNGPLTPDFTALSGLTFTRALAAYGQTSAGALTLFGSGVPRITDKGLLIEGARTNLCLRSQEFDNASWTKTNITVTPDAGVAPDGTQTADLCTVTSTAATNLVQATSAVTGTNCCASIYVQNVSRTGTNSSFFLRDSTAGVVKVNCSINWDAMTVSGTGASIKRLGSTNWYRIILLDTAWTTTNVAQLYAGATGSSLTGGQAWYPWGAQIEAAAFPSSYIPTTTTSVTRAADIAIIAVSGLAYPITLFAEFERVVDTGVTEGVLAVTNVAAFQAATLYVSSADKLVGQTGGVTGGVSTSAASVALGQVSRSAMRALLNDVNQALNGTAGSADVTASYPATPDAVLIGGYSGIGHNPLFGYVKRAAVWPTAFSDANLQAVSS